MRIKLSNYKHICKINLQNNSSIIYNYFLLYGALQSISFLTNAFFSKTSIYSSIWINLFMSVFWAVYFSLTYNQKMNSQIPTSIYIWGILISFLPFVFIIARSIPYLSNTDVVLANETVSLFIKHENAMHILLFSIAILITCIELQQNRMMLTALIAIYIFLVMDSLPLEKKFIPINQNLTLNLFGIYVEFLDTFGYLLLGIIFHVKVIRKKISETL